MHETINSLKDILETLLLLFFLFFKDDQGYGFLKIEIFLKEAKSISEKWKKHGPCYDQNNILKWETLKISEMYLTVNSMGTVNGLRFVTK